MTASPRPAALATLFLLAACIAGCATPPPASDPEALAEFNAINDPLEPTNRVIYAVNDGIDTVFLKPIALLYRNVVPDPIQKGAHNALENLGSPVILANDMLQGKPKRAGDTLMRLVINTTAGVGGIFDVAKEAGYDRHDNGFGTTLALWGAGAGPYLYLPVFGPSNPRDTVGLLGDMALDPLTYTPNNGAIGDAKLAKLGLSAIDARVTIYDELEKIQASALDPYATIRSASRQYRAKQIKDAAAAK